VVYGKCGTEEPQEIVPCFQIASHTMHVEPERLRQQRDDDSHWLPRAGDLTPIGIQHSSQGTIFGAVIVVHVSGCSDVSFKCASHNGRLEPRAKRWTHHRRKYIHLTRRQEIDR
jgi:hypothetical protein